MTKVKINIGGVITEMEKEEVSKAIEAGELNVKAEDAVIYKKDDFEIFKKNLSDEEYKKGKSAGEEMLVKTLKEQTGIDVEGKKPDVFINAFKSKILEEAKVEPSKKIQELEADKTKLLENYKKLETDFTGFKTQVEQQETTRKKDSKFLSFITESVPANQKLVVDPDIAMMVMRTKAGIDVSFDDKGNPYLAKNGEMLKDSKTLQPIEPKSFIAEQFGPLNLLQKQSTGGGSGAGDYTGGGTASGYDAFVKEMKTNGIDPGSEKFALEMNKRIKEKTLTI